MDNAEQFRRYLKRLEVDGNIIVRKESCLKVIERCERWVMDKRHRNMEMINTMTFEQWIEQEEIFQELFELCEDYRRRVSDL